MSEYRVIITETLKRAVTVEAESREEAEEAVRRQYQNSEHILVAEDFDGVSFSAQYPEQQVELPYGKMKELFRKAERAGTHVCGYITFIIFSLFASTPPVVDPNAAAVTQVWSYIGELIFNLLVLVGTVKMADRVVREMMGL